jgi:hypothetical protein
MSKRALVGILLLPAIIVVLGLTLRSDQVLNFILGPVDDPQYFCFRSDPSPVVDVATSTVLQECSAGKTVSIRRGETIAVDLQNSSCVDSTTSWHDFHVSDGSILQTVVAQTSRGGACTRSDEIAVYRAVKTGQSSISAVQLVCGGIGGGCGREHRWKVTVAVS